MNIFSRISIFYCLEAAVELQIVQDHVNLDAAPQKGSVRVFICKVVVTAATWSIKGFSRISQFYAMSIALFTDIQL